MYGVIHSALKQMVVDRHGTECWQRLSSAAGHGQEAMLTMRPYDDAVTLSLIEATAKVLDLRVEEALRVFGRYWIIDFAPGSYGTLLAHTGHDTFSFLDNLNNLHDRIATAFAEFRPPVFTVERVSPDTMRVNYHSTRQGLTPFVVGLLEGMQDRFDEPMTVTIEAEETGEHGDHTTFLLRRRHED